MKPDEQRAYDHYRWADRYNRQNEPKKAAAHLRRAVQLHRGTRFGAPMGLVLSDRIYNGVYINSNRSAVYNATLDGRHAVCKVMRTNELKILQAAQGDRVVRILDFSEDPTAVLAAATGAGAEDLRSKYGPFKGTVPSGRAIVAMEKLRYVELHPEPGVPDTIISTDEALQKRLKDGPMYSVHKPHQPTLLRELLDAIVYLNNEKMVLWRNVDQSNTGVDDEGRLRIYDFGYAGDIHASNMHMDILAYGKLLYNALVQSYALGPGSHYESRNVRLGGLSEGKLVLAVSLLSGASEALESALHACFSLIDFGDQGAVASVVSLLYKALQELGA